MEGKVKMKELAAAFGMKVNELADFLGYTRQALYQTNDGTSSVCTGRYYAALMALKARSDKLYAGDLARADELRRAREHMIRQMSENVGVINVVREERGQIKEFAKYKRAGG